MIVKILSSASKDFHGVKYNDKKVHSEKGELMLMKNFPSFINSESSQQEVRNYLKSISQSKKVQKPQFHAVISTKFQQHSKEELTQIGDTFMKEMGYENQPYLIVFHKDTENNHVHIVSSRVDRYAGKKINDSFEKLKSQRALSVAMEKHLGIKRETPLDDLLAYKVSNFQQMELLLKQNGYKILIDTQQTNNISILKNGVIEKILNLDNIVYSDDYKKDNRSKQIRSLLEKYKNVFSNKVFKVIDDREEKGLYAQNRNTTSENIAPKIAFESELQHQMRKKFGIDIVFHFKDDKNPFGYTLIDNATEKIYKGSDILKMKDLFEFAPSSVEKKEFEQIKDFNIRSEKEKKILQDYFLKKGISVESYMLFENKNTTVKKSDFQQIRNDVKDFLKNTLATDFVALERDGKGDFYAIHQKFHQIHSLEYLIGKQAYEEFINNRTSAGTDLSVSAESKNSHDMKAPAVFEEIENIGKALSKSAYTGKDTTEDELKKRRKKRR